MVGNQIDTGMSVLLQGLGMGAAWLLRHEKGTRRSLCLFVGGLVVEFFQVVRQFFVGGGVEVNHVA